MHQSTGMSRDYLTFDTRAPCRLRLALLHSHSSTSIHPPTGVHRTDGWRLPWRRLGAGAGVHLPARSLASPELGTTDRRRFLLRSLI